MLPENTPSGEDARALLSPLPAMPRQDRKALGEQVLRRIIDVFGDAVLGVIIEGSAVTGDFIPHWSDLDVHAYIHPSHMVGPLRAAPQYLDAYFQAIAEIDPKPYGVFFIQTFFVNADNPGWAAPTEGTYDLLYGELPDGLSPKTGEYLQERANEFLTRMRKDPYGLTKVAIDSADPKLSGYVRFLGTQIKSAAYSAATLDSLDPMETWERSLGETVQLIQDKWCPSGDLLRFFQNVWRWDEVCRDGARLAAMYSWGLSALSALCSERNSTQE